MTQTELIFFPKASLLWYGQFWSTASPSGSWLNQKPESYPLSASFLLYLKHPTHVNSYLNVLALFSTPPALSLICLAEALAFLTWKTSRPSRWSSWLLILLPSDTLARGLSSQFFFTKEIITPYLLLNISAIVCIVYCITV